MTSITDANSAQYDEKTLTKMSRHLPVRPLKRKDSRGEPTGAYYAWEANGSNVLDPLSGKYKKLRKAFNFAQWGSPKEALEEAERWITEARRVIKADKNAVIEIPLAIRPQLLYWIERCKEKGYELNEVFRRGVESLDSAKALSSVTFAQAATKCLEAKAGTSKSYRSDLAVLFKAAGARFGSRKMGELSTREIKQWLDAQSISPVTYNNKRRMLVVLWSFAGRRENGWVTHNVVSDVAEKEVKVEEVSALKVKQAETLLATAHAQIPRLIPYLCLGMFAGLRRSEAQAARWEDIDWDTNSIRVQGGKMRDVSTRYVDLPEAFKSWIKPIAQESGPLCTGMFARRDDLKALRELTFAFDGNIFRHSYGSYHMAAHKNANLTAAEMGHTTPTMLFKHYRKPIAKEVASQFWGLTRSVVLKEADPSKDTQGAHAEPAQSGPGSES